mmetsp:Transcript_27708/g.73120  ORF Transcript_27708/g.73120 Transcript_27708/m.73120 type:complete len:568 (-) Transcript_27708:42-1745(-)
MEAFQSKIGQWVQDHAEQAQLVVCIVSFTGLAHFIELRWPGSVIALAVAALFIVIHQWQQNEQWYTVRNVFSICTGRGGVERPDLERSPHDDVLDHDVDEEDDCVLHDLSDITGYPDDMTEQDNLTMTGPLPQGDALEQEGPSYVSRPDVMSKARLDLLFRCMAREGRCQELATTPQRTKLQRKLLQRAEAERKDSGEAPDVSAVVPIVDELQDFGKIEELLRELGEADASVKPARCKVLAPSSKKSRRKNNSLPQKSSPQETEMVRNENTSMVDGGKITQRRRPRTAAQRRDACTEKDSAESRENSSDRMVDLDFGSDVLAETSTGEFQVVANRKTRKKRVSGMSSSVCDNAEADDGSDKKDSDTTFPSKAVDTSDAESSPVGPDSCDAFFLPEDARGSEVDAVHKIDEYEHVREEQHTDERRERDEHEEDWEWQCPSGHRMLSCRCARETPCSSCGAVQPVGSSMLMSVGSDWAACESCIKRAMDQPLYMEETDDEKDGPSGGGSLSREDVEDTGCQHRPVERCPVDPRRMSTAEIVDWFIHHGAEEALRQCMTQVLESRERAVR